MKPLAKYTLKNLVHTYVTVSKRSNVSKTIVKDIVNDILEVSVSDSSVFVGKVCGEIVNH